MKIDYKLKIIEQIIIVMIIAVLTPMVISGIIISNINQHTVRRELNYSVSLLSEVVVKNLESSFNAAQMELNTISLAIKHLPKNTHSRQFLESIRKQSPYITNVTLEPLSVYKEKFQQNNGYYYDSKKQQLYLSIPIDEKNCLIATINQEMFTDKLFDIFKNDERQVYLLDKNRTLIFSTNFSKKEYEYAINSLPEKLIDDTPKGFGTIKNQPLAYYQISRPGVIVIVNTTGNVTKNTINIARSKIILAIVLSVLFIFVIVGLYTSYLYINIRQLFKGIMAISKGNYKRKIRLLANIFTPYELIFLANEFNSMVEEINLSYIRILQKNKELKKLDELKSNLIDTVSHEFRTPLTSITGYTSRLMRKDIQLDKETEEKSIKIIKRQAERLSRMVEDLLVIPDIEGSNLHINMDKVNVYETAQLALHSLKSVEVSNIKIKIAEDFPYIYADKDRFEQIFINLLENAKKYATEDTDIIVSAYAGADTAYIKVENEAPYIPQEKVEQLFGKFTRLDDTTTRTTRGTGLGLFIVKGLVEAMNGTIKITSTPNNKFTVNITMLVVND